MTPYQLEQIEILRRIAKRGKKEAERYANGGHIVDVFVHLLDEIKRLKDSTQ